MSEVSTHGAALHEAGPSDDAAVRAVFAEQRALLDLVRSHRLWIWLGGMPSGFGHPKAALYGLYLAIAFVAFAAVALVVAGFDRGVWFGFTAGLAAACLVARAIVEGGAIRRTKAFYGRAVQLPAVVVAYEAADDHAEPAEDDDEEEDEDAPEASVAVLVGTRVAGADDLAALLAAGARLRDAVLAPERADAALASCAAAVRKDLRDGRACDGSRQAAPEALGPDLELALLHVHEPWLPSRSLDSRLLFVLADLDRREAGCTRFAHHAVWGPGAVSLSEAVPLEDQR